MQRVLVLINPRSGLQDAFASVQEAFEQHWERRGAEVFYQFSNSKADGEHKARRAVEAGVDAVVVAGGDGTVNSIGRVLAGTAVTLGVIPTGSGNGFARHFGVPMDVGEAVAALAEAAPVAIDVGRVDGQPFFVTCGMAWDAAIVRSFERYPIRGVLPYILAGVQEFFEYTPQDIDVRIDDGPFVRYVKPIVFTVANLTQYGGGARIAPSADGRDGMLELVVGLKRDAPRLLANLARLFDGTIDRIGALETIPFRSLEVRRATATAIQIDGELVEAPAAFHVGVDPAALRVLVPAGGDEV